MSGGPTEPPTPRRLAEARRRGEVAYSRELTGAAALAAGLLALAAAGRPLLAALARVVRGGLAAALEPDRPPGAALLGAAAEVARLAALPVLAAVAAALATGLLQTGGLVAPAAAAPRPARLDPASGLRALLSGERLLAAALGVAKAVLVLAVAAAWARGAVASLAALPRAGQPGPAVPGLLAPLGSRLALLLAALGAADLLRARWGHRRRLRMTREAVRRELREDQGDPRHREARQRSHRALLEAGPVSRATCVVVNPTHLAVALRHERGLDEAPRVVAKGRGGQARRIRSEARRAGVPVVRDVALARALHALAEVGEEIPEPLYQAAAGVLAHLHARAAGAAP